MASKKFPSSSLKKHLLLVFGTGFILILALGITLLLHQNNVEDQVYTNNYTTSLLFSDSLASASGAAPWALISLNWFVCRSAVKRWISYVKKQF